MKTLKTGLLIVFAPTWLMISGCATDAPEPPAAIANISAPVETAVPSLLGSKWHYSDDQWQYDLEFAANGVLLTTHPNDKTKDNDTWEQDGVNVSFYFNNKFSRYRGTLSGNNLMTGAATNQKGTGWDWKATRAE